MESALASITPARDRCLPVDEAFAPMLPDAGLQRGRVIGCTGPASVSLALALATRAVTAGSWLAVVGVPALGVEAAIELGVAPSRLVLIDADGPIGWAERVAAAADGFELILTRPPAGADRMVRKVRQRLQARGVVMLVVGRSTAAMSCDIEVTTTDVMWDGLGDGVGHLVGRRATVRVGGRRVPRPTECEMWLPGPGGRVALVEPRVERAEDTVALRAG